MRLLRQLSVLMTVIVLVWVGLILVFAREYFHFEWKYLFLLLVAVGITVYFSLRYVIKLFILDRLLDIYATLLKQRNGPGSGSLLIAEEDPLDLIQKEISGLAEDRKNESDRLKKLELYRREYIGNVSHELKTPVFNIQGYILTLLEGALEDKNVNRNYLRSAERSVERMIHIIDDLDSITQLETGELSLEIERLDIVALARDVCDAQEMIAKTKGIIFSLKNEDPFFVWADRFRIRQVLTNLIVNSVKYGKDHGETIIRVNEVNGLARIELQDNGIGVSADHLPRLFERFYRVDKSRSRDQGGTGLGLSIVKHILEAHGQTIQVMSKIGEGTLFSFTLPISKP